jgi:hypothetical protein
MFSKDIVIITAWDAEHLMLHTTTWGRRPDDKVRGADGGVIVSKALGSDLSETIHFEDFRITAAKRLLSVLKAMASMHGGVHDADCPEDDTCACRFKPFNDLVNKAITETEELIGEVDEAVWEGQKL